MKLKLIVLALILTPLTSLADKRQTCENMTPERTQELVEVALSSLCGDAALIAETCAGYDPERDLTLGQAAVAACEKDFLPMLGESDKNMYFDDRSQCEQAEFPGVTSETQTQALKAFCKIDLLKRYIGTFTCH
ncbi:MAG: hypothetical protein H6626_03145 [Pseudobdellovibrionaceae bacterium]|nr:hypothetical protein [Bdellovibrionales bacterium]USN48099.1 MAG: hypothetical protein H6626_03145 [Pseudobdellovibrionaceae bacterium]